MMLALNERPSHVDGFLFVLGEKLGKTVSEIRDLPNLEILQWQSYFKAKAAIEGVRNG